MESDHIWRLKCWKCQCIVGQKLCLLHSGEMKEYGHFEGVQYVAFHLRIKEAVVQRKREEKGKKKRTCAVWSGWDCWACGLKKLQKMWDAALPIQTVCEAKGYKHVIKMSSVFYLALCLTNDGALCANRFGVAVCSSQNHSMDEHAVSTNSCPDINWYPFIPAFSDHDYLTEIIAV